MGGFSFPTFDLDTGDPDSRFLDLFNQFSSQSQNMGQYLQPDDPDLQRYQELAGAPSRSDALISEYLESLPSREEYKPSLGRKIAATFLGALSGDPTKAYAMAQRHTELPYERALEQWKLEGTGLTSRARMADAERNRELQALKFGLTTKAGAKKSEAMEGFRRQQEARRVAQEVQDEEAREAGIEERRQRQEEIDSFRKEQFEQRKSMDEWRKAEAARDNQRAVDAAKTRSEVQAEKAATLDAINKRLSSHASQMGIDASDMTALDVAKSLAFKKAKAHPAFGDLIEEVDGEFTLKPPKYGADRIRILENYINSLAQKYLKGEF